MHPRFIQLALLACFSFLLVPSIARSEPTPFPTPGPIPTAISLPSPTVPPIPTPTPPGTIITPVLEPPPTPTPLPTPTAPPIPAVSPTPDIEPQPIDTPTPPATPPPQETPSPSPFITPPPTPDPGSIIDPPGPIIVNPPEPPPTGVNPDEVIPVIITFGEGLETRADIVQGLMLPVGVPRQKSVTVTLLLPSAYAGQVVNLGLYDGGRLGNVALPGSDMITLSGLEVPVDGQVRFNFEAGALRGLYRLAVAIGPNRYLLQFYATEPRQLPVSISLPPPPPTPSPTVHPIVTPQPPPLG